MHIFFSSVCVCACVRAGGSHRGDPQQQRPNLLQDLPGGLLLRGGPEAPFWTARHQLREQRPPRCRLPGGHGVHLRTGTPDYNRWGSNSSADPFLLPNWVAYSAPCSSEFCDLCRLMDTSTHANAWFKSQINRLTMLCLLCAEAFWAHNIRIN